MTRDVITVGPDSFVKQAAEVMAQRGFAALPVVDEDNGLVGIVAEADVLRGRLQQDPRLHLRRDGAPGTIPPLLVRGVMTTHVRTVLASADVADLALAFLDEGLRSVPVLDDERLVGIVSRRDALHLLARSDDDIRHDVRRLVEFYTGRADTWSVTVAEGVVDVSPVSTPPAAFAGITGAAGVAPSADGGAVDAETVGTLARTVPGVVAVRVHAEAPSPAPGTTASP
jgi:CBS domain-containing protein